MRKDATAVEACRATGVEFHADGAVVTARQEDGREHRWQTKFVVDASGRDTVLANQFGIKRRNTKHNSAAIFGHFPGAARLPGKAEGNISLFWFDHGWFWFIPLHDGATSVGAVCWPYYMKLPMRHGAKLFPRFIYRVATPTLRDLFMNPGDSRLQEAVLSVLAGDIFRGTPPGLRLFAFKRIYYLTNFFNPRRTLSAWKKRKQILSEPSAETSAI